MTRRLIWNYGQPNQAYYVSEPPRIFTSNAKWRKIRELGIEYSEHDVLRALREGACIDAVLRVEEGL
jgi:hypothetical protein